MAAKLTYFLREISWPSRLQQPPPSATQQLCNFLSALQLQQSINFVCFVWLSLILRLSQEGRDYLFCSPVDLESQPPGLTCNWPLISVSEVGGRRKRGINPTSFVHFISIMFFKIISPSSAIQWCFISSLPVMIIVTITEQILGPWHWVTSCTCYFI